MTMTHKEALVEADKAFWWPVIRTKRYTSIDAAIRAYIEARGLVLVPRDTGDTFSNSSLPSGMVDAGGDVLEKCDEDLMHGTGPDWDYGMQAVATFRAMLAYAPDPFKDDAA